MKNLLDEKYLSFLDKKAEFDSLVNKLTKSYKFQRVFISSSDYWSVLTISGLYSIQVTSDSIVVNKNSAMRDCSWQKCFKHTELKEVVNFLAENLSFYPLD